MSNYKNHDQRQRNQFVVNAMDMGTWEWNVQTGETDFNERWAEIVGYTLDELRPLSISTWQALAHPEDLERSNAALERHFAGEDRFYETEARMRHKLGHWVWVLDRGKVISWTEDRRPLLMYGAHLDISSRKAQELALSQNEERFRALIDATSQTVWSTDAQGIMTEVDPSWTRYTGQSVNEAANGWYRDAVHPDDAEFVFADWYRSVEARLPSSFGPFRLHHVSGEWRWNIARNAPVHDGEGNIVGWIGMTTDIHEHHENRIELEDIKNELEWKVELRTIQLYNAKREAEEANKAKTQFISNISHELRTPLSAMIGYGRNLLNSKIDKKSKEQLTKLNKAGDILLSYINDVLDFSKLEANELQLSKQVFDLQHKLLSLISVMSINADEKGLRLILDPLPDGIAPQYMGDPIRLRQILLNLIGNAIKFSEQGEVRVRAHLLTPTNDSNHRLRFEVEDTGIGIAPSDIPKLFNRFSQVGDNNSRRNYGTGLGLAIVKQLSQLMGGDAGVQSTLGVGSTFWFEVELKVCDKEFQGQAAGNEFYPTNMFPSLDGVHILAVDDSELIRDVIDAILSDAGAVVECCEDGRRALDRLKDPTYSCELVLTDIQMPVMDGNEMVALIRQDENLRHLPIIAMTAGATQAEREESITAGVDEYVTKPFQPEDLVHVIRQILKDREVLNPLNGNVIL
ncbi:MAG: PAS domain-containing protein [Pseudomonadota bacterium]